MGNLFTAGGGTDTFDSVAVGPGRAGTNPIPNPPGIGTTIVPPTKATGQRAASAAALQGSGTATDAVREVVANAFSAYTITLTPGESVRVPQLTTRRSITFINTGSTLVKFGPKNNFTENDSNPVMLPGSGRTFDTTAEVWFWTVDPSGGTVEVDSEFDS